MKKHGFTLIELIITIVIMAGIFAVIPKIVFTTAKSDTFSMKQDALTQALSLTEIASALAWDENNTDHLDILQTESQNFECNTTLRFRPGSYLSPNGRMCEKNLFATLHPGPENGENDYTLFDDIDDFNAQEINASVAGKRKYKLITGVHYLTDAITSENATAMTIDLSQSSPVDNNSTNIKKFTATVRYAGKRGREYNISTFSYYSTNIGQISLAYRNW
jgi:prepilin-type N-terminal cleavage/methylation domain-containing protein